MSFEIPDYRVVEKLGEGNQTRIFRARSLKNGSDFAVKIVKIVRPEDRGFVDLLRTEYAIGSVIDHPVIRKVHELRVMRQRLSVCGAILFMEYVQGLPMSDRSFYRPYDELLDLFKKAAHGLHAMHLAGYVHADLKPNNILVTHGGDVKLIDLGQSARIHEAKDRVQGTIDYMAPEQAQRRVLDQRTDVFGLGAALHRVVTGRPVATEMNQTVSMYSQGLVGKRVEEVRKPTLAELPTCMARMIEDCCQANPEDRIRDMPSLIGRFDLVQTILSRESDAESESTPSVPDSAVHSDSLAGTIADALGHDLDDESVDLKDIDDLDELLFRDQPRE